METSQTYLPSRRSSIHTRLQLCFPELIRPRLMVAGHLLGEYHLPKEALTWLAEIFLGLDAELHMVSVGAYLRTGNLMLVVQSKMTITIPCNVRMAHIIPYHFQIIPYNQFHTIAIHL